MTCKMEIGGEDMSKRWLMERIELYCDADRRGRLMAAEMKYCPTVGEALDAWAE